MVGNTIIGLKFYISGNYSCQGTIRMAIVSESTFSDDLLAPTSLVEVWSGLLNDTIKIDYFTSAFAYTGGNLLIDIQTEGGSYMPSTAAGFSRSGASICTWGSNYPYMQNFLPKVDFIYSDQPFCTAPSAITMDDASDESLTFHWTPGGTETAWMVLVGDSLIGPVYNTSITVNDLESSSLYAVKVRSICSEGDTSGWSARAMMQTACVSISSLPREFDFEIDPNNSIPICWTISQYLSSYDYDNNIVNTPYIYNNQYYSHSGSNTLRFDYSVFYQGVSDTGIIATPYIAHNPADLHVTFWLRKANFFAGSFEAGIMGDPADPSTFVPLMTITPENAPATGVFRQYEFYTSSLTTFTVADSVCVAFRAVATGSTSNYTILVDDVVVDVMGDCLTPTLNSGIVDSLGYDAVRLSWQSAADVDNFVVRLINHSTSDTTYYLATDTTISITNLVGSTVYSADVATICFSGDITPFTPLATFTTHQRCYAVQGASCVALTANAAALAWTFSENGIEPSSVELVLTDLTDLTAAPESATVSGATNHTFVGLTEGHLYQVEFRTICGASDSSETVTITFTPRTPPCAEVAGSSHNQYVPFYSFYSNGFTESLYDASIIGGVDSVVGISLDVYTALNRDNFIDIYMGYTSRTSLSGGNSGYVPVSQMTQVVSNYMLNTASTGWTEVIPFNTPFLTQPTGDSLNLVIAFFNHTGYYTSGLVWGTHTSPIGTTCYAYTDATIDVSSPWSGVSVRTTSEAPNIQLHGTCGGGDCVAPSVSVSDIDSTTATLTWLPGGSESSWTVQYRPENTTAWITDGTAIVQPYTITDLNPGTNYFFRLGADCSDTIVFSPVTTASTACGFMHAPVSIYPDGTNNCWTFGPNGAYGGNYYYFWENSYIVSPPFADSISALQVKISGYNRECYIGACDANGANPTWIDTVYFHNSTASAFETRKIYLNNYTGSQKRLIFKTVSGYNYTYISNITIEPIDNCMPVNNLHLDSITATDAWLSWQSEGSDFEVKYHAESDTTNTWISATSTASTSPASTTVSAILSRSSTSAPPPNAPIRLPSP